MKLKGRSREVEDLMKSYSLKSQSELAYIKPVPSGLKEDGAKEGSGGEPPVKPEQRGNKEI